MKNIPSSLVILCVLSFIIISCKNSASQQHHLSSDEDNLACHITSDSLLGKGFLDAKFLEELDKIPTHPIFSKSTEGMVLIQGGTFDMGGDIPPGFENLPQTALPQPDEFPKHAVQVSDFYMDTHEVTVREYLEFVKATHYKTVAEYDMDWEEIKKQLPPGVPKPDPETLKAGALVFQYPPKGTTKDNLANWWKFTKGVNWKNPSGKPIALDSILDMPVTQVSWYDALAYAKWQGKRLPTEAEFEYAMRAGKDNTMYPWGNEMLNEENKNSGNFLQGEFPYYNEVKDGYEFTAPIKRFTPNAYGLYDMAGNVWEWTMDWYGANYYKTLKDQGVTAVNPQGPEKTVEVFEPNATNKVVRGGSFLCNDSWCSGYRNARRMRLSPDSGMQHVGFRCVRDVN